MSTASVLREVDAERGRQDDKFPDQHLPDLDPVLLVRAGGCTPERMAEEYEIPSERRAKAIVEMHAARGDLTWAHVLVEEVAEAIGTTGHTAALRAELVQVAAVAVRWIEDIDHRAAAAVPRATDAVLELRSAADLIRWCQEQNVDPIGVQLTQDTWVRYFPRAGAE